MISPRLAERIAAARARRAERRHERAELQAARDAGLVTRHRIKLARTTAQRDTPCREWRDTVDASPVIQVPAELVYRLARAAGALGFAAAGRFSVPPGQEEKLAELYDELADQASDVLDAQAHSWLERRVEHDQGGQPS